MTNQRMSSVSLALTVFIAVLAAVTLALGVMSVKPGQNQWLNIAGVAFNMVFLCGMFIVFRCATILHDTRRKTGKLNTLIVWAWITMVAAILSHIGAPLLFMVLRPDYFNPFVTRMSFMMGYLSRLLSVTAIPLLMLFMACGRKGIFKLGYLLVIIAAAGGLVYQLIQLFYYFVRAYANDIARYGQIYGVLVANVNLLNIVVLFYIGVYAFYGLRNKPVTESADIPVPTVELRDEPLSVKEQIDAMKAARKNESVDTDGASTLKSMDEMDNVKFEKEEKKDS